MCVAGGDEFECEVGHRADVWWGSRGSGYRGSGCVWGEGEDECVWRGEMNSSVWGGEGEEGPDGA